MNSNKFNPSANIFDLKQFGEFGDVNPSITDSSTYTFLAAQTMVDTFHGESEGCFLYSRHWNPSNKYLSDALAAMEGTPAGWVTASGMAAITTAILQLCNAGDHIITSVTTYGGTFAFLQNYLPKFNIEVSFVNIADHNSIEQAIRPNTRLIYTETLTNPLLQVSDIPKLAAISKKYGIRLIVDNTFVPLIVAPSMLGADITVYSMTKFVNGKNDCVAGAICSDAAFIDAISNVNDGTAMLLGPVLDPLRSSSILKNLHTLHIRMRKHSENALYLSDRLEKDGLRIIYPGLSSHKDHDLMKSLMNPDFGFGGMMAIDMGTADKAYAFMERMQNEGVGYLAVSLGYFKTLFSNPGKSTSSEVPEHIQREMGLSEGLVRFSVGLDHDIERTYQRIKKCL
ncbi:MAG TPA: aminotransferase class I/II-fold pyridoxal phosphate-dependent enzyme [Bacteroidales bacterium]|nr:aminotransferase class I/II-fold pyridoxal phosphate-dependent enzyme [Bacteroidales bacterium]